jgi:DNA-binding transcriptional ArsR family regulator
MRALREEDVFQAIANPVRREILRTLSQGKKPASELARPFRISLPAVSQHLRALEHVGLVSEERVGKQRIYQLNPKPLKEVYEWVQSFEQFWSEKLVALGEHLKMKHGER